MKPSRRRQRGMAIVTAVAVAALVAALASFMAWRFGLWLRQVDNQHDMAQARIVARAAVNLARLMLQSDARRNDIVDHAGETWAMPIPSLPVEKGTVGGRILDAQGRFNLNNLVRSGVVSGPDLEAYQRLLAQLGLREELAMALVDWIDADDRTHFPGGAEDQEYLSRDNPYRTSNRELFDLAELARVQGYTPEVVERLEPFVTALPQATTVNVNFAPAEVLMALLPGLDLPTAQSLVRQRETEPFLQLSQFTAALPPALADLVTADKLSVTTRYFYTDADARFGRVSLSYRALVERFNDQVPRIVWMKRK
ncbi:type II secretion system minor pseudopilin GspK [Chitinimonas lacunae]|uniref:Type II secretion system protein K n=1 Tax=Chitinimonas lacunae TaxID=1963018 RepID=A0ABV8MNS2_9NEIS